MNADQRKEVPETPTPDGPAPDQRAAAAARFRRIMTGMALVSLLVAILAVVLVASGDSEVHIHMLVATGLGVFLAVLLGTALMSLAFLSASSGYDSDVQHPENREP